jgi:ATP-dependent Lhr-like helicase
MDDSLAAFSPPVSRWFREEFSRPTPPQSEGWPPIQRGEHTLILAPTGSGKTLAAFLWGIDRILAQEVAQQAAAPAGSPRSVLPRQPVILLYISPLKALNNDIERNLRAPLAGIRAMGARLGQHLPSIRVALRTGDTPSSARAAMLRQPPHILITTPESLYLMLTSPRAREMFRGTRTVIVDEIHTLVGEKRGAHLGLTLERLSRLAGGPLQRIGLSATVRPLDEAARFLGGQEWQESQGSRTLVPRPVTIVDTGYRKPLEIQVVTPVEDFRNLPGDSIWPAVIPQVLHDVMLHRTTLIFCNNRRLAERTADRLNAQISAERSEEIPPGSPEALAPGGVVRDRGIFAIGAEGPIRAHHGSTSREARRQMEEDLKAGRLAALVGTSSLELGIDIGSIDLVVQLQSPKSIAQGLQRVGRSGHLVGQTSRGRIYATYREDLVEAAAVARGMLEGDVEPTRGPANPLDVLAQQIVAMVAVEEWSVPDLFDLIRQAYAYRGLPEAAFNSVLEMLSGRYLPLAGGANSSLRARIAWDRANQRLASLPGSRLLALSNAGTIPDTGAYDVYLADGKTRLGTLDEGFIFETRPGDTFLLGSNTWRVLEVGDDRVIVGDAAGSVPRMPFWRGDYPWRPFELGMRIGQLRRRLEERIRWARADQLGPAAGSEHSAAMDRWHELTAWLREDYALEPTAAQTLVNYVRQQIDAIDAIATDRTIVVESFTDAVGDGRMVVHSPFGGRVNGAWALAISDAIRERASTEVETQVNDDGILIRLPQTLAQPPVDVVRHMDRDDARSRILRALPDSAVFGAHFRMNAARALLLPRARGRKRTPFWLQRLKAKDLLAVVRRTPEFPILAETTRDCLRDVLDLPHLEQVLDGIADGSIRVIAIETAVPSPVAASLLFQLISVYMYEWDAPKAELQLASLSLRSDLLDELWAPARVEGDAGPASRVGATELRDLLRPEAVAGVLAQAGHLAPEYGARSLDELAVILEELGDLTTQEVQARCNPEMHLAVSAGESEVEPLVLLERQGRVVRASVPSTHGPESRWVPAELKTQYSEQSIASCGGPLDDVSGLAVLQRFLRHSGPVTRDAILERYAFDQQWLDAALDRLVSSRELVRGIFTASREGAAPAVGTAQAAQGEDGIARSQQYCDRHLLERIRRRTLAILRREVRPVPLETYASFLAWWQGAGPAARETGLEPMREIMHLLRGVALPAVIWERDVLPVRLRHYDAGDVDALCETGELFWVATGRDPARAQVHFIARGEGGLFLPPAAPGDAQLSPNGAAVYRFLEAEGASFVKDLQAGTGLAAQPIQVALVELALAGMVTNDLMESLYLVLNSRHPEAAAHRPLSTLESELEMLRPSRPVTRVLSRERYHAAKRQVARRLQAQGTSEPWPGRWYPVHRDSVLGPAQLRSGEPRAEAQARVLLARYGIVSRESVERENGVLEWSPLAGQLARMELRGEIRRGYFVVGLSGLQYALPEAIERLRSLSQAASEVQEPVVLNAADPANIYGSEPPQGLTPAPGQWPRFARVPTTHVVTAAGKPVLVAEDGGGRMTAPDQVPEETLRRAVTAYLERPYASRRVHVTAWNGSDVLGGPGEPMLKSLGFSRTPSGLEWRR